ncbi:MAG: hypothetical protein U1E05_22935, partial [Patescibacteria group bacterium]|nr:hypothetical protein [Patescibacteria group bacterium]
MRVVLVACPVVTLMAVPASAAVVSAYDGFHYGLGGLSGANGGTGWTNAWKTEAATYLATTVVEPGNVLRYVNTAAGIDVDGGNRAVQVSAVAGIVDF